MWVHTGYLYLLTLFNFVSSVTNGSDEVVFVILLYRHGDRTPIEPYPTDPYKNNSLWPTGWGELTNVGKRGHYELGKWLRKRYDGLLPRNYKKEDIYIRSTDVDRTLMSAYSNLAGLYEPDLKNNWNQNIKWTPIPVHTIPEKLDRVLAGKAPCPKYSLEMNKLLHSPAFMKINEKYEKLYDYLSQATGSNIKNITDVERIYDILFIENLNNFTLPNWTKNVFPQPMKSIAEFSFSVPCYTRTLARLKMGPFLKEVLTNMERKIAGKMNRKAHMYSAHDTTVANVLKTLDLFQPHSPPYLSLILFELRKMNEEYFVAIYYRNSSSVPPYLLELKGCEKLCPFQTFKSILSAIIPDDWERECRSVVFPENIYDATTSIGFVTIIFLVFLLLTSLTVVFKFYKNQKWNQAEFAYRSLQMDINS